MDQKQNKTPAMPSWNPWNLVSVEKGCWMACEHKMLCKMACYNLTHRIIYIIPIAPRYNTNNVSPYNKKIKTSLMSFNDTIQ